MPAYGRKQLANFSARLAGTAAGQGCLARLPGNPVYSQTTVSCDLCQLDEQILYGRRTLEITTIVLL
jgi:hypothetical protein